MFNFTKTRVMKISDNAIQLCVLDECDFTKPSTDIYISKPNRKGYTRILSATKDNILEFKHNSILSLGMSKLIKDKLYDKNMGWLIDIRDNICNFKYNNEFVSIIEGDVIGLDFTPGLNRLQKIDL